MAAPRNIWLQSFYITWSKTGDSFPPTYSPVRKTEIQMVKGTLFREVNVDYLEYVPRNGTTLPMVVTLKNPPYQELIVNISFYKNMSDTLYFEGNNVTHLARLNKNHMIYQRGENMVKKKKKFVKRLILNFFCKANYSLNVSNKFNGSEIYLYFALSGYDQGSFKLNGSKLLFQIIDPQTDTPNITYTSVMSISRSVAVFRIFADVYSFIFFVIGDMHMPMPTFNDVRFKNSSNITLKHSHPIFSTGYVRKRPMEIIIEFAGLKPGHEYEAYFYSMNMNEIFSPNASKLYFRTKGR
jgi:hypothetical protein